MQTKHLLPYCLFVAALASAQAQTVLIDNTTLNGSFEAGTGITPSNWVAFPVSGIGEQVNRGASTTNVALVHSGTYSLVVGNDIGGTLLSNGAVNTGHSILLSDTFTFSFWYNGALNWDPGDQINFQLFYTSDNTLAGTQTAIYSGAVNPTAPGTGASWQQFSMSSIAATPGSVGKTLFVSFTPGTGVTANEFARVDEVALSVVPEPAASVLAGAAMLCVFVFRRRATLS